MAAVAEGAHNNCNYNGGGSGNGHRTDVDGTLDSGQVFLWDCVTTGPEDRMRWWYGVDGQRLLRIDADSGAVDSYSKRSGNRWLPDSGDLFRSSDDPQAIEASLMGRDAVTREAVRRYPGLRIMRQDPYQCTVSFIVSANSNMRKIRANLAAIARMFGEEVTAGGAGKFHLFPTPARLAGASVQEVRECGVGYRAEYVVEASKMILSGEIDFGRIAKIERYGDATDAMLRMPGVGNKVADCIMLFSLERTDAFPLDRWMMRALHRYYGSLADAGGGGGGGTALPPSPALPPTPPLLLSLTDKQYRAVHDKMVRYFGRHAGYAQQLLFKMARDDFGAAWLQKTLKPRHSGDSLGP